MSLLVIHSFIVWWDTCKFKWKKKAKSKICFVRYKVTNTSIFRFYELTLFSDTNKLIINHYYCIITRYWAMYLQGVFTFSVLSSGITVVNCIFVNINSLLLFLLVVGVWEYSFLSHLNYFCCWSNDMEVTKISGYFK